MNSQLINEGDMMPRTKEKFEEMRIKSKNNIIQAALKLFSTKGYHATSTNAIAKEAGVAAGLMYNYFSSKEELLVSIIDQFFQEIINAIPKEFTISPHLLDIRKLIDALLEQINMQQAEWRLLIGIMFQPDISQTCKNQVDSVFLHQSEIFAKYYEVKGMHNPEETAKVLASVLHGAILSYVLSGNYDELMLVRKTVIEKLIEKGIQ